MVLGQNYYVIDDRNDGIDGKEGVGRNGTQAVPYVAD